MPRLWGNANMMNLIEKAKAIPGGTVHLSTWVGSGGMVVSQDEAQERANTCLECVKNEPGLGITSVVAAATKRYLEFKNKLELRVNGEKKLLSCELCGCELRLQIWQPIERVKAEMNDEEIAKAPDFCWKIK